MLFGLIVASGGWSGNLVGGYLDSSLKGDVTGRQHGYPLRSVKGGDGEARRLAGRAQAWVESDLRWASSSASVATPARYQATISQVALLGFFPVHNAINRQAMIAA